MSHPTTAAGRAGLSEDSGKKLQQLYSAVMADPLLSNAEKAKAVTALLPSQFNGPAGDKKVADFVDAYTKRPPAQKSAVLRAAATGGGLSAARAAMSGLDAAKPAEEPRADTPATPATPATPIGRTEHERTQNTARLDDLVRGGVSAEAARGMVEVRQAIVSSPTPNPKQTEEALRVMQETATKAKEDAPDPVPPAAETPPVSVGNPPGIGPTPASDTPPIRPVDPMRAVWHEPSEIDATKSAERLAKVEDPVRRQKAFTAQALRKHTLEYGRMYASGAPLKGASDEQVLRRRAVIDTMTEGTDPERKNAARAEMATKSDKALGDVVNRSAAIQALASGMEPEKAEAFVTKIQEKKTSTAELLKAVQVNKAASARFQKFVGEFGAEASGRMEKYRAESEISYAKADSSGRLAKDLGEIREREMGIRKPSEESTKTYKETEKRIGGQIGLEKADKEALQDVHRLGGRYGFDSSKMESPEQVRKARGLMAFAEAAAGDRSGRDREKFLKAFTGSTDQQRQQYARLHNVTQKDVARADKEISKASDLIEKGEDTAKLMKKAEKEEKRERGTLKAMSTTIALQRATGMDVEDISEEDAAGAPQDHRRARKERREKRREARRNGGDYESADDEGPTRGSGGSSAPRSSGGSSDVEARLTALERELRALQPRTDESI